MAHAGGRPPIYDPNIHPQQVDDYLATTGDKYINMGSKLNPKPMLQVNIPKMEGLALYLGLSRSTLYEWIDAHPEFSDKVDELLHQQATYLVNKGLSGEYNSRIASLLLYKHGYVEKSESDITSKGKPIPILGDVRKNDSNTEDSETK